MLSVIHVASFNIRIVKVGYMGLRFTGSQIQYVKRILLHSKALVSYSEVLVPLFQCIKKILHINYRAGCHGESIVYNGLKLWEKYCQFKKTSSPFGIQRMDFLNRGGLRDFPSKFQPLESVMRYFLRHSKGEYGVNWTKNVPY